MRSGFKIGKLFGITIRIDWSWMLIFLLVTWNLSTVFGEQHGDWSTTLQWGMALLAALLFFASVLAHELAHSLVAQARGVNVHSITMFLFGGVSNIQRHPDTPASEFLITIVGPLTSLVLGFGMLLVAGTQIGTIRNMQNASQVISQLGPLGTMLVLLGSVNIALGVFNLIPGFPLDGGRLLRSILWTGTGDLRKATRWASWVGQGIAWLMIGSGVAMIFGVQIPFFGQGFVDGLWLAFIGWFLNTGAMRSYQQVVVEDMLEDVPVRRIMRSDPPTVAPDANIDQLVDDHIMKADDQSFPVMEDGKLVGIVALKDVRKIPRSQWSTTHVKQIMTPADELEVVTPDEDAAAALSKLTRRDVRQLPVKDDGELLGVLRRQDIVKWLRLQSDINTGGLPG